MIMFGKVRLFGLGVKHHEEPCQCRAFVFYLTWFAIVFPVFSCDDHAINPKRGIK